MAGSGSGSQVIGAEKEIRLLAANRQARGGRFSGKGVIFVQNEIDPRIGYTVLGIIAVLVIGFFIWRLRGPTFKPQTSGSEAYQREYDRTGRFYQPPPGANVPNPYAGPR